MGCFSIRPRSTIRRESRRNRASILFGANGFLDGDATVQFRQAVPDWTASPNWLGMLFILILGQITYDDISIKLGLSVPLQTTDANTVTVTIDLDVTGTYHNQ